MTANLSGVEIGYMIPKIDSQQFHKATDSAKV